MTLDKTLVRLEDGRVIEEKELGKDGNPENGIQVCFAGAEIAEAGIPYVGVYQDQVKAAASLKTEKKAAADAEKKADG